MSKIPFAVRAKAARREFDAILKRYGLKWSGRNFYAIPDAPIRPGWRLRLRAWWARLWAWFTKGDRTT